MQFVQNSNDRPTHQRDHIRRQLAELVENFERDGALPNTIVAALIDRAQRLRLQLGRDERPHHGRA